MAYTTSVTTKGQVTIPQEIRRMLDLVPHDQVTFAIQDGQVCLTKAGSVVERTKGLLKSNLPPASPAEEKRAAEEQMAYEADPPRPNR